MNRKILLAALTLSFLSVNAYASERTLDSGNLCYSAYHVQQYLDLAVKFGDVLNRQKTEVDLDIHVREIPTANKYLALIKKNKSVDKWKSLRSYVVLVKPNFSKNNGNALDRSERYRHPFMAVINGNTGEILAVDSTTKDRAILNEYVSFFDLFQYSNRDGEYHYRNGNGYYIGKIVTSGQKPNQITKSNRGYLRAGNKVKKGLKIIESSFSINLAKIQGSTAIDCFYRKGDGVETFQSHLSGQAAINGDARIVIVSDRKRVLMANHGFFSLTSDLESWPSLAAVPGITKKLAFAKLPGMLSDLSKLTEDKAKFLQSMLANSDAWPYLAEYILENELSNELSLKLFWSLDKIDNSNSVNALVKLVTAPLNSRDHFRGTMALGSTSAPLNNSSIELLTDKLGTLSDPENVQDGSLTFVRTLGVIASNRLESDPLQSQKIKDALYSKVNAFEEMANIAVIDAIGNLGDSIDDEGVDILMQGTTDVSDEVRLSAASAFTRIPYKAEYSEGFIRQLETEGNIQVKTALVEVLGYADKTDKNVKDKLLDVVRNVNDTNVEYKSLKSLKKINYTFKENEIKILEAKLRNEPDLRNQRLLAAMILKHRRK